MRGRQGFIWLMLHIIADHIRKSGQELNWDKNLGTGADAETMDRCCLLV